MHNGSYKTYTSTLASSDSSRAFSLVGCLVPYRHFKVLDQERTNHLIQDQEHDKSATERNEK